MKLHVAVADNPQTSDSDVPNNAAEPDPSLADVLSIHVDSVTLAGDMHILVIAPVLALLTVANGTPVLATKILGERFAWPLDFGLELPDGQRLLGRSKTVRGAVLAVVAGGGAAPLVGLPIALGLRVALLAMFGDLLSSFVKRRLRRSSSSRATGLDQIPESLLPLLACISPLGLTLADVAVGTAVFFVGETLLSRLLFRLHLREQPY